MDWSCYLFSVSDGNEVGRLKGHDGEVNALAFQQGLDGFLASVSDDKSCIREYRESFRPFYRLFLPPLGYRHRFFNSG